MAGVMTASPKNIEAPRMPMTRAKPPRLPSAPRTSATSDSVPPSPLLSAYIKKRTYFSVTTRVSDQMSSDTTPVTSDRVRPSAAVWCKASRKA